MPPKKPNVTNTFWPQPPSSQNESTDPSQQTRSQNGTSFPILRRVSHQVGRRKM
ncbi:unnamed protein product [Prunus armeniaca]|uniref:Uncharacterized protein n=1 Tax=Prunus armeniaca TaxID=36596 RepID=A0A6J5V7H8_PRUAR|nr:unnamed protein product [Prunus armeniaca]